jgi:MFS family permease
MASSSFAFVILAPILGKYIPLIGRKNIVIYGLLTLTLSGCIYACVAYLYVGTYFFIIALIARTLQGVGNACVTIGLPAIIAVKYPEMKGELIGLLESSTGIGLMLSGSVDLLKPLLGYQNILFLISGITLIFGGLGMCTVPSSVNQNPGGEEKVLVTFRSFFKRKFAVLCLVTLFFASIFYNFNEPIF